MDTVVAGLPDNVAGTPDGVDPLIVLGSIAFTEAVKRFLSPEAAERIKPFVPLVVLAFAIFLRTLHDVIAAEGLSWSTVGRGLAAAGVAVFTHAQFRGIAKATSIPDQDDNQKPRLVG